jgi:hypothetical protein
VLSERKSFSVERLAALILFPIILVLLQFFWLQAPLERDQSIYFLIAHQLIEGRDLYSDLWDHKPPAIHFAYVLAQIVVGYSIVAIWLLGVVLAVLTAFGLDFVARNLNFSKYGRIATISLWIVFCYSPNFEATQPNTEAFINLCWIWGLASLTQKNLVIRHCLYFGILSAIASVFKPIALILFLATLIFFTLTRSWRLLIATTCAVVIATILLWASIFYYFNLSARLNDFYQAIVIYNQAYAGNIWNNLLNLFGFKRLFPLALIGFIPFLLCSFFSPVMIKEPLARNYAILILLLVFSCYLAIAMPGNFYLHYYQYLLVPVALLTGLLVSNINKKKAIAIMFFLFSWALIFETSVALFPEIFSHSPNSPHSLNVKAIRIVPEIKNLLKPGEWFYEWGAQPGLYFETGILPRHGVYHAISLYQGPLANQLTERTLKVLQADPPALIVLSDTFINSENSSHQILLWIRSNYSKHWQQADLPFELLIKN